MDTKAAFEKWCTNQCNYTLSKTADGNYRSMRTNLAFKVWTASRAAIEIDISPENFEALVTTCQHLIEREGYSEHSANLRLIAKLALPMLTSHGIRIKGKTS